MKLETYENTTNKTEPIYHSSTLIWMIKFDVEKNLMDESNLRCKIYGEKNLFYENNFRKLKMEKN